MTSTPPKTGANAPVEHFENPNARWRVITASLAGTSIEFYDFYIYATAASLVFPHLFFPSDDPTTALLASFAVFGVAFIARPVGSVLFGHFGDRIGRKGTLVATLLTMGIATFLVGLLPTATTPGWEFWAPFLLVVMRFCQGLGLGGEWSGAALLATENAPANKRAIYGTFPQLGAPIGFILGNTLFVVLSATMSDETFMAWGWRIPFLISAVLVILGLWVRFSLLETPAFQKVMDEKKVVTVPLVQVFKTNWLEIILGTFIMLATYVLFYLMTAFTLTFGTKQTTEQAAAAGKLGDDPAAYVPGLGYHREEFLIMLIVAVVFFGIFTLVSGPLAERFGRRKMLLWTTGAILVFGFVMTPLLGAGFIGVQSMLILGMSLMGLTFGPMAVILPELFPANVRYTGSAIAYNLSSVLGAAIAPSIFIALWAMADGSPIYVGLYLAGSAVLTFVALLFTRETRDDTYVTNVS
ncbi:MHS family MFS transporter [Pseudoclavibacter chungangensis]|uniref:Putative proline/betaine transporter n=1 Tax=Pseudoclavibacter chungangensis TaxID=587635 RepID=A0A7J5BYN8_9MICO|nr:MFS transporter [Pseudoclavibacter chungangensis]KAB1659408.1 MHS family MFS transporter [Pseudoclavibacter chungangensis]NYJ67750.1 metabolite-proton symporter [Pseudoclavibacter chungangensis]